MSHHWLDLTSGPLAVLLLLYAWRGWRRGWFANRAGQRITRQARSGAFWFEILGTIVIAALLAAAAAGDWWSRGVVLPWPKSPM